jgi:hypothetical protein
MPEHIKGVFAVMIAFNEYVKQQEKELNERIKEDENKMHELEKMREV